MNKKKHIRIAFAGDRKISVDVLAYLISENVFPLALMISHPSRATHADKLVTLCSNLSSDHILTGKEFRTVKGIELLKSLNLDFIISIHFPYVFTPSVLDIPKEGVLNLHPAYLPYNRGWHTPSWAILENTPIGATLHFMDEGIDTGDIVYQRQLSILPEDTADTLYKRINSLELHVFKEAWPLIHAGDYIRQPQKLHEGTTHNKSDLMQENIQSLILNKKEEVGNILVRLKALTTNVLDEAAYFKINGVNYHVRIFITKHEQSDIQ